jgi:hypothetical protein
LDSSVDGFRDWVWLQREGLRHDGSIFAHGAPDYWTGTPRNTMFLSASKIAATISAADITTANTVMVYVRNPGGSGIYMNQPGQNSNIINFAVKP